MRVVLPTPELTVASLMEHFEYIVANESAIKEHLSVKVPIWCERVELAAMEINKRTGINA